MNHLAFQGVFRQIHPHSIRARPEMSRLLSAHELGTFKDILLTYRRWLHSHLDFNVLNYKYYISTALPRILMFDTRISSSFLVHRVNLNSLKKYVTKRQAANSKMQLFPRTKCLCLLKSRNCRTVETLHLLGYLRAFINKKLSKKWSHACNLGFFLDFSNISYSYIFLIENFSLDELNTNLGPT